ncbi:MAG: hypothetical protein GXO31_06385 [Epsilonproteobacteria bacterium]|nr:hypothetical protein [Campylobacterota bacterium]
MENTNATSIDEFELRLEEKLKILKECQEKHNLNSCLKCEKVIGCEIRKEYVSAVYQSMNKGKGGGFEF